jgi:PTS system fructose-specific IIA component
MEPISLDEILDRDIMGVHLPGKTKKEAIDVLSRLLLDKGYISEIAGFEKDIYYRETLGITGIGNYVAIPHGQSSSVLRNGIAIGKFDEEIPWESIDGKGVHVVCLFSVQAGDNAGNVHLKMLASLAAQLGKDNVIDALLTAETVDDMVAAFKL